jgi:lipoate-protein ligase A
VSDVEELYDYDDLRTLKDPTMIVARVERPTLVLGSGQSREVIDPASLGATSLRRRRGGGGVVLLRPRDLWVDWWIPRDDARWSPDVHLSSLDAGTWWSTALQPLVEGPLHLHRGALEGARAHRVVCFAGRGPGEVFLEGRKLVGVTQWRVREGVFLSSVLGVEATIDVLAYLADAPAGLADALDAHPLDPSRFNAEALLTGLRETSGPWEQRAVHLVD